MRSIAQEIERARVAQLRWDRELAKFGLTQDEYDAMLAEQEDACAICMSIQPGAGMWRFAIDHDHETGAVRGLLCAKCNMGLGLLGDNLYDVMNAYVYLRRHEERVAKDAGLA